MADRQAPRGTGVAGKVIWQAISESFDLEPHELAVLRQIAVVADRISDLDKAVSRDGVLIGDRAHPALVESRLQRITLGRLLAVLRLPDLENGRPQRRAGFRTAYRIRQVMGGDSGA
jgi:hypothetical protein